MAEDVEPSAEALAFCAELRGLDQVPPRIQLWRQFYEDAARLDAFAARAVAAERERCLRIIREEIAAARVGSVRGSIASIADAIWRGER